MLTPDQILGKKLAFVIAHPDDESYLAAGTIYSNQQAGGQTIVICATAGERGQGHLKHPVPAPVLKSIRQQELEAVGKILQLNRVVQLGLPDGEVEQHYEQLLHEVRSTLEAAPPDYIFSFARDGITGHRDHIAVGQATQTVAKILARQLLTFARPSSVSAEMLKRRQRFGKYKENLPRMKPNLIFSIDPKIKWACLCAHSSQMDETDPLAGFPEDVKQQLLHYEYFYAEEV